MCGVDAAFAARHIGRAIRQGLRNASRQALLGERRAIYARLDPRASRTSVKADADRQSCGV
jgi:hypothetical protein